MSLPTVESLSGLQESVFSRFSRLQLNSRKKYVKHRILLNSSHSTYLPTLGQWLFGVLCWGHCGNWAMDL